MLLLQCTELDPGSSKQLELRWNSHCKPESCGERIIRLCICSKGFKQPKSSFKCCCSLCRTRIVLVNYIKIHAYVNIVSAFSTVKKNLTVVPT